MSENMRLAIIFCANNQHKLQYANGSLHPEQPGRVETAKKYLKKKGFDKYFVEARDYDYKDIYKFLEISECSFLHLRFIQKKFTNINSAYSVGKDSYLSCIEAVKCIMTMCDLMKEDKIDYAINLIRPPGHHACHKNFKPAGFCLVNTAIIAAKNLLKKYNRLSIFDIDLHHGGGTQKMMEDDERIMYTSIHNRNVWTDGLYSKSELHKNKGRVINVGLPGLSNDKDYLITSSLLIKKMKRFSNEMLILSAGIDAHKDEIGVGESKYQRMNLTNGYYGRLGNRLRENFEKVFVILEGGYNEKAIAESFEEIIKGLMGKFDAKIDETKENKNLDKILKKIDLY